MQAFDKLLEKLEIKGPLAPGRLTKRARDGAGAGAAAVGQGGGGKRDREEEDELEAAQQLIADAEGSGAALSAAQSAALAAARVMVASAEAGDDLEDKGSPPPAKVARMDSRAQVVTAIVVDAGAAGQESSTAMPDPVGNAAITNTPGLGPVAPGEQQQQQGREG